jgi:myo-inositol 2-dehydrogenase / D-chiro-inositol 1-dehydrogenase
MAHEQQTRLAFIGAGGFATESIYPCIPMFPFIDLVAVCDLQRERAERNARNFGARNVYTDLEEMLDREKPDGVFCIGPAPQQYALAPYVLRRGIPVYVEKPSAVSSAQARELAEMAEQHGAWGQVGFMKRFAEVYRMAREVISRPEFGPLHMVKVKFAQGPYPQIWGIDSARRSMLIGQLCHIFDLVRYFGGQVSCVQAMFHGVTDTQFAYSVTARYESGALGMWDLNSLECETAFRDIEEELQLVGLGTHLVCRDMLTLDWQPREDWTRAAPGVGRYLNSFRPASTGVTNTRITFGYAGEVEHFARRCLGQVTGGPDLWDSYWSLRLGEAVYQSAESGQAVHL